jgi:hypothetical protein
VAVVIACNETSEATIIYIYKVSPAYYMRHRSAGTTLNFVGTTIISDPLARRKNKFYVIAQFIVYKKKILITNNRVILDILLRLVG